MRTNDFIRAVGCAIAFALPIAGCDSNSSSASGGVSGVNDSAAAKSDPRPGPDILYAPPADAPQLSNSGIWQAPPILISGASAYRGGEFLYQDFLYDDHGANGVQSDPNDPRASGNTFSRPAGTYTYPTDKIYANNAADLVEFRVKPLSDATAFRVALNTLLDPERVAFTLVIGDSDQPRALLHGANTATPAALFLTVHGAQAELVDAATGMPVAQAPGVAVDMTRRQFEVRVPHADWDPGTSTVRMALGVGLWDAAAGAYLLPQSSADAAHPGGSGNLSAPSAFFNAGFRFAEPLPQVTDVTTTASTPAWWRDRAQAAALAAGDLSPFHADVDFAKLAAKTDDDMNDQPTGVPTHGPMDRILASHFETGQGADYSIVCGGADTCLGELRGQLQPYALYVPDKPAPAGGYGLTLLLHSLAAPYNQYLGSRNQSQLGDRGRGYLVITPAGRGPDGWYVEYAGADSFEVWADVARHYPLNPDFTVVTGYSMGGYGTFRFATRFPDLFAKAQTTVGPPAIGIWVPPSPPTGGDQSNSFRQLASMRNVPILMWAMLTDELVPFPGTEQQARGFDDLAYRYEYDVFSPGDHLTLAINDQYAPVAEFLGDAKVDRNPPHVTYVVNPKMDFPGVGMVGDHAYWLSGLTLRDPSGAAPLGSVDALSHAFGLGDPTASATQFGADALTGGTLPAIGFNRQFRTWGDAPGIPVENTLDLVVRNLATVTVHPGRAKLDCNATLNVDTDGPLTVQLAGCNRTETFGGS